MKDSNKQLVQRINEGDETAFRQLFYDYYPYLHSMAEQITKSSEQARDVVQEVFLKIWNSRADFGIKVSLDAYLYRSVRNQALNFREKQKSQERTKNNFANQVISSFEEYQIGSQQVNQSKIVAEIWKIVQTMPDRRRIAFTLSRKRGLTYEEISAVMDISQKTVEYHIGAAVKDIRRRLKLKKIDA
jgi:RNA polymerase sigma-70 factor (ECF subfamily)